MKNRRTFLTALSLSGLSLVLAGRSEAQSAAPTPSSAPSSEPGAPESRDAAPAPKATSAAKPPSAAALAAATAMRRFDADLNDADIATIARGIDRNAAAGARLNPKKKRLRNSDEPVTTFVVPFA